MPAHAIAAHLVIATTPVAAIIALTYAVSARARQGMRWPLVVATIINALMAVWAGDAGSRLYHEIKDRLITQGSTMPEEVVDHAHLGDWVTVSSLVLVFVAAFAAWRPLAPGRPMGRLGAVVAVVLGITAVAVVGLLAVSTSEALEAVWDRNPLWPSVR